MKKDHTPHDDFLKNARPPFKRGKDEIWDNIALRLDESPPSAKVRRLPRRSWAVAAAVIFLLGFVSICKFYTNTISTAADERLSHILPDGSTVLLNAESQLSYQPLWWWVAREMQFEGEGFFEVAKGRKFSAISENGTTQVLGTSFNISTRDGGYAVYCQTGKVGVTIPSQKGALLTPGMFAKYDGDLQVTESVPPSEVLMWKEETFNFNAMPLQAVFHAIEQEYGISIQAPTPSSDGLTYTGNYPKPSNPEQVLQLVCGSFGWTFEQDKEGVFVVSE